MNYPVLITQQGETIAVAYDQAGIELAVQEHYVTPDNYLVGIGFMKAEFSDGMSCDLEEVVIYPYAELEEQQPSPEVAKLVEALEEIIDVAIRVGPLWHGSEQIVEARAALAAHRKPKTHIVNGVEIPDLRVSPKQGDYFYLVDPLSRTLFTVREHTKKLAVKEWVERGLVYLHTVEGKQAAILHSKAMLGIG